LSRSATILEDEGGESLLRNTIGNPVAAEMDPVKKTLVVGDEADAKKERLLGLKQHLIVLRSREKNMNDLSRTSREWGS